MRKTVSTLALALLTGTAAAAEPVIIENDHGGVMAIYEIRAANHRPMEIRGYCASACTMYLYNPYACVHPDAVLIFHAPSAAYIGNKTVATRELFPFEVGAAHRLMAYYPQKLQEWIMERGGLKVTTTEPLVLRGDELAATGINVCAEAQPAEAQPAVVATFSEFGPRQTLAARLRDPRSPYQQLIKAIGSDL